MKERYIRNKIITEDEQINILKKTVAVFGVGGLGGYVVEELARFGIGKLIILDFDVFSESNLNRQILSTEKNIGFLKAECAELRINEINSDVKVEIYTKKVTDEFEIKKIIKDSDLVIDALDTVKDKLLLEKCCEEENKILIHGAICGYAGQVSTIFPNDKILDNFYKNKNVDDKKNNLLYGNPSFIPAIIASIQVSEAIKVFVGDYDNLIRNSILFVDLKNNEFDIIMLK